MKKNWNGLVKILDIKHLDVNGNVKWQDKNIYNMLHTAGEEFILNILFAGEDLPDNYYFGLDNRTSLTASDEISDLITEQSGSGYSRQVVINDGFNVIESGGVYQAQTPILSFNATGAWSVVQNLFMTDKNNNSGTLISSAALSQPLTLSIGESITIRMGLSLKDCP